MMPTRPPDPTEVLTSADNPRLKATSRLRKRRGRNPGDAMLVDGHRALALALGAGIPVYDLFVRAEGISPPEQRIADAVAATGTPITPVASRAFARIAYGNAPDGLVAVVARPDATLAALETDPSQSPSPLLLVVERVEKPGNLGALLRTADGAGAQGVLLCDSVVDPFGPNTVRSSRGALFSVPLAHCTGDEAVAWLRDQDIPLAAMTPDGDVCYTDLPLTGPCAIALGAEDTGLSEGLIAAARWRTRVPLRGQVDSLNVAACGAAVLYEAVRQRGIV